MSRIARFVHLDRVLVLAALLPFVARTAGRADEGPLPGIAYKHVARSQPLPVRIHILKIDLTNPRLALAVESLPDPDGHGPAETALDLPLNHARRGRLVAGVNTNAWTMMPDPKTGKEQGYVAGGACDVLGLLVRDGQRLSPADAYWSFWIDGAGKPGLGVGTSSPKDVRLAVSGFGRLVQNGNASGATEPRHPRTALGLTQDKRHLILAVVDGRQPGISEGMSERELAELMVELGCYDAFNLDGGGSSVMILRDAGEAPRIVNRPSDKTGLRPIPVFFGVREAGKHEQP